jgi:hypothetical protein
MKTGISLALSNFFRHRREAGAAVSFAPTWFTKLRDGVANWAERETPLASAPRWVGFPTAITVTQGGTYSFAPYAVDDDGEALTYSLAGAPGGYSINAATGLMTAGTTIGTQAVTVRITDAGGRTADSPTCAVTVQAVQPPASGFVADSGYTLSGTIADGATLTISGTGFGTKQGGGRPLYYFPYTSDLTPHATLSRRTAPMLDSARPYVFSTTSPPPNNPGSCRLEMNDSGTSWGVSLPAGSVASIYTFAHRRFGYDTFHDGVGSNHKFWRIWRSAGQGFPDFYSSYSGNGQTTFAPVSAAEGVSEGPGGESNNDKWWDNAPNYYTQIQPILNAITTQWHTFEQEWQNSSAANVADAVFISWTNGAICCESSRFTSHNSGGQPYWEELFFSQISNNSEPAGGYFYYGPTLVDDSRCRIIVSNEATWNTGAAATYSRDFCVPITWADGQITMMLRQGIHTSLAGKYLYVVRSNGTAVRIGRFS